MDPRDVEAWSVRWVLLHLIEETARHAGHADIVRESIDGAQMYELMAAVEGLAGHRLAAGVETGLRRAVVRCTPRGARHGACEG